MKRTPPLCNARLLPKRTEFDVPTRITNSSSRQPLVLKFQGRETGNKLIPSRTCFDNERTV